jgi:hypothetical protein
MSGGGHHHHHHTPGSGCCEHEHVEMGGGGGGAGGGGAATGGPSIAGGAGASLLPYIDTARVRCLNEATRGSAARVFKPLSDRADKSTWLESSGGDPELLVSVPFTANVRVRAVCVSGGADGATPSRVRLFTNREDLDFDAANAGAPAQEVLLSHDDPGADTWHPLRPAKFNALSSVQLHFRGTLGGGDDGADGADARVYFIGLKGDYLGPRGAAPATIVYEARPQAADHPAADDARAARTMGV